MRSSWSGPSTSTSRASARRWGRAPTSSRRSAASDIDSASLARSRPERGHRGRGRGAVAVLPDRLPGRDQFGADDGDLARGLDPEPDLAAFEADDGHAHIIADVEL